VVSRDEQGEKVVPAKEKGFLRREIMLPQHKIIFEPINIRKIQLDNRIVLAPTHVGMGDEKGMVTDQYLCYYYTRASGGVGLVIVEITGVTGRYAFIAGRGLGAASDRSIPGLRDLARVIHWGGAKAFIQLAPGHGAQAMRHHKQRPLVGPSDVPALVQKDGLPKNLKGIVKEAPERPHPLDVQEIKGLGDEMVRAAGRAKGAGFDGIEIHGAHGYLLCQFTSPYYNRRNDDYGGSPERRWRFSLEIIRDIKETLGQNFVVGYRFSAREWIPDGLDLPESIEMAKALEGAGADYLSVSQGCYGSATHVFPAGEGAMTEDAAAIRKAVSIPVMCPNFQSPDKVADAISNGSVDLVALSRPLLADPLWARKVKEGRPEEIQHCKRCYQCIRAAIVDHVPARCPVNPKLGFERFDPQGLPRPAIGQGV
jgi:2,4-dienoyl-CoA reductase-like NADH-dependent reductase (Old Yellow Enzyme family)